MIFSLAQLKGHREWTVIMAEPGHDRRRRRSAESIDGRFSAVPSDEPIGAREMKQGLDCPALTLRISSLRLLRQLDHLARAEDLTSTQWFAMRLLYGRAARTAVELADKLQYDTGAIARSLDGLEKRGLLVRSRSKEDRRIVRLELSRSGRETVARLEPSVARFLAANVD
jgi:DNA-binding MarR family transcriptional regulator